MPILENSTGDRFIVTGNFDLGMIHGQIGAQVFIAIGEFNEPQQSHVVEPPPKLSDFKDLPGIFLTFSTDNPDSFDTFIQGLTDIRNKYFAKNMVYTVLNKKLSNPVCRYIWDTKEKASQYIDDGANFEVCGVEGVDYYRDCSDSDGCSWRTLNNGVKYKIVKL